MSALRATKIIRPSPVTRLDFCPPPLPILRLPPIQMPIKSKSLAMDAVIAVVCEVLFLTADEVRSKNRHERVVAAREIIVVLARAHTTHTFPAIALAIRNRSTSHATAIDIITRVRLSGWENKRMLVCGDYMTMKQLLRQCEIKLGVGEANVRKVVEREQ